MEIERSARATIIGKHANMQRCEVFFFILGQIISLNNPLEIIASKFIRQIDPKIKNYSIATHN